MTCDCIYFKSLDNVDDIAPRLLLARFGVWISVGIRYFFSSPKLPDRFLGPPSIIFNVYRGYFQGLKRTGHDVDNSLPSSAEVKN
jgi:hypothetical protein